MTTERDQLALERVLFFSDAVFAIAITLLVLELRVPAPESHTDTGLIRALTRLIPRFVGFVISFFLIGQTWVEHHRIGRLLVGVDRGLIWMNLFLLFFVATLPFATAVHSEFFGLRVATVLYAAVFGGLGLAKTGLWRHAVRRRLVDPHAEETAHISRRVWATPIAAAVVIAASLAGLPYAVMGFLLIPVLAQVLDRRRRAR